MSDHAPSATARVRIEPGGVVTIDADAWVRRRIRDVAPELTRDLLAWADAHPASGGTVAPHADSGAPSRCWPLVARLWCADRGFPLRVPDLIEHTTTRLNRPLWVLRAHAGRARSPIVVLGTHHRRADLRPGSGKPVVCRDAADAWDWLDADSVVIACPGGHRWTWRAGRELVTADGRVTTVTVVWGPDLDAPFSECPQCAAHRTGTRPEPCDCDGTPWIVCPSCRRRCDLDLPPPAPTTT